MRRINAKSEREISDSDIAQKMDELNVPYVDLGNSPVIERSVSEAGDIIDIVKQSGSRGESFKIEISGRDAMRLEEASNAARFAKSIKEHPLITLD